MKQRMIENISHKERNPLIDVVKGLAILLVIYGHVLQTYYHDWERVYMPILMCHMPLFMFLSGLFVYPSVANGKFKDYVQKKYFRLLQPWILWGV